MSTLPTQFGLFCKSSNNTPTLYSLRNCVIRKETEKAYLVCGLTEPNFRKQTFEVQIWVPKSIILEFDEKSLYVPAWFKNKISGTI